VKVDGVSSRLEKAQWTECRLRERTRHADAEEKRPRRVKVVARGWLRTPEELMRMTWT
jgi:hypothetical protein